MSTVGAVLCGGASRRMGRDKALIEVDGRPMAARVAAALRAGGCDRVLAVGGDAAALEARVPGLETVPDRWPGEGPLGGLATALSSATRPAGPDGGEVVLVLAPCDWLAPAADVVAVLLDALDRTPDASVAVPLVGGRRQWVHAAWRVDAGVADRATALLGSGARRLADAADLVEGRGGVVEVAVAASALIDADTPGDLA